MLAEPRAIFYQTQLDWPPSEVSQFRVGKEIVRGLFNKMFDAQFNEHRYENLDLQVHHPTLSRRADGRESVCQFAERSITIEEKKPDFGDVEGFVRIVQTVLSALHAAAEDIPGTEVPPFFLQRCRIHCLCQVGNSDNSLHLLAGKVANVLDPVDAFERPPSFFGVRFRFPPTIGEGENQHRHEDFAAVRFETYAEDFSQVWMEVTTAQLLEPPVVLDDLGNLLQNVRDAYRFLTQRCKAFLDRFDDQPDDEQEDEGDQ
jgi:hypothetical protein